MRRSPARPKKKRVRLPRLFFVGGVVLALLGGLVYLGIKLLAGVGKAEAAALPFPATQKYAFTGTGFLYQQGGKLLYHGLDDAAREVRTLEGENFEVAGGKAITVIYHATAMKIVGVTDPIEFNGTVLKVRCGSAHAGVVFQDAQGQLCLQVYNAAGELKDEQVFANQALLDFGFSPGENEALWTLDMDTAGELPASTIKLYNMDKDSITGVFSIQSQAVDRVLITAQSVFVAGTNHLIRYGGSSEAYRLLTYGYDFLDFSAAGPAFLYVSRNQEGLSPVRLYLVEEADIANEKLYDISLPADTLCCFLYNSSPVAVTPTAVIVYKATGAVSSTVTLEEPAVAAWKLDNGRVLIETAGSKLSVLSLR